MVVAVRDSSDRGGDSFRQRRRRDILLTPHGGEPFWQDAGGAQKRSQRRRPSRLRRAAACRLALRKGFPRLRGHDEPAPPARSALSDAYAMERREPTGSPSPPTARASTSSQPPRGGFVEAAWIPEEDRSTLCLSVQVGCKMGCLFCMTGKQGFQGHLDSGEIVNQFASLPERERVTNIVYMGMGEPWTIWRSPVQPGVLCSSYGFGLSPTRITVSTVGIIPAMRSSWRAPGATWPSACTRRSRTSGGKLMPVETRLSLAGGDGRLARGRGRAASGGSPSSTSSGTA